MTLSYIFDITLMLLVVVVFAGIVGKNFLVDQDNVIAENNFNEYKESIINSFLLTTLSNYPNTAIIYYEN